MLVFGVGTALAAVAGVIAGPALVTQSNMAGLLGPILFVVVVVGGLGSLPGAFVASLLIGLVQTFAVSMNGSLSGAFGPLSAALRVDLARRHLERHHRPDRADHALRAAGADPDLPPDGPAWDARHMSEITSSAAPPLPATAEKLKFYGLWVGGRDRSSAAAEAVQFRRLADDVQPDRHLHHLLAVLQHPARPDRHAVVRTCGLLRPRRLPGDPRHQHDRRQQAADPAAVGAADRRTDRPCCSRSCSAGSRPSAAARRSP